MSSRGTAALLNISGVACQKTWSRQASRITKYKNPFVGGIYKKTQLPLSPRDQDEYATEGESIYPDIPGEYPPGEWGKMDRGRAWRFYDRGQELLKIGSLRERLYEMTKVLTPWQNKYESKEKMKHWLLEPSRDRPYFFPFVQYVTKTRLHRSLPPELVQSHSKVDQGRLKKRVENAVSMMEAKGTSAEEKVAAIVEIVNSELLSSHRLEHLVEGQMEEGVTFEAAWRRGGFAEDDMEDDLPRTKEWNKPFGCYSPVGGYTHADPGIINFQGRATPFLSLRSKFPLKACQEASLLASKDSKGDASKEVVATSTNPDLSVPSFVHDWVVHDDHSIPLYAYHPSLHGLQPSVAPPTLNAGYNLQPVFHKTFIDARRDKFWTEKVMSWNAYSDRGGLRRIVKHHHDTYHPGVESDPRGFPHTAFALPVDHIGADSLGYNIDEADEDPMQVQQWNAERMLTTLFTWNVASAYYQGFCSYLDLTYPIASQGVLTDGDTWQFYALRTDSMAVWRDDDAFFPGSVLWMSRVMKMETEVDVILTVLTNFMSRETERDMTQAQLQPFVTKSDEIVQVAKPKYDFEMKVL